MTEIASASRKLAEFCLAAFPDDGLPSEVATRAKELTLDMLGVAVRGSGEASSKPGIAVAAQMGTGAASVIGGGAGAAAAWAALANGTSAHAIEMDDVTTESSLHPGVAIIPAAFALAEELGSTPTAFLAAVASGYEVTMRVGNALNPASAYARGFHPTGVAGAFGAAVAAGRLLGLDADRLTRAIGVAGSMASGSLEYLSDGAWTKRLNAGWAAHAGLVAAQMARAGFVGPETALEGRLGTLTAYSDEPYRERLLEQLGEPFQLLRVSIKPYACCRYNHGFVDGMLSLVRRESFELQDVERIRLGVLTGGAVLVADPIEQKREPKNIVDAQFSAPFAAAVALVRGAAGFEQYSQPNVDDATIRGLMARTDCMRDPELDALYPAQWPSTVEIQLKGGRTLREYVPFATGEPENPVVADQLVEKFIGLTGGKYTPSEASGLATRLLALEKESDLRSIGQALR